MQFIPAVSGIIPKQHKNIGCHKQCCFC